MGYGNQDMLTGHTGGEICHFKLLNYLYLTIMWWARTQFWCSRTRGSEFISNSTSSRWRWILTHSCENTSFGGEPTIPTANLWQPWTWYNGPWWSRLLGHIPGDLWDIFLEITGTYSWRSLGSRTLSWRESFFQDVIKEVSFRVTRMRCWRITTTVTIT